MEQCLYPVTFVFPAQTVAAPFCSGSERRIPRASPEQRLNLASDVKHVFELLWALSQHHCHWAGLITKRYPMTFPVSLLCKLAQPLANKQTKNPQQKQTTLSPSKQNQILKNKNLKLNHSTNKKPIKQAKTVMTTKTNNQTPQHFVW